MCLCLQAAVCCNVQEPGDILMSVAQETGGPDMHSPHYPESGRNTMEYGPESEMGEIINPSLRTHLSQPQVRRSYQRSGSGSSDTDNEAHQKHHHTILNMNRESRFHHQSPRNESYPSEMTRDQKASARKALIDFGQMSKAQVKSSQKNKGFLFDDDGVDLLSRLADKRPEVIGGNVNEVMLYYITSHLTLLGVGWI